MALKLIVATDIDATSAPNYGATHAQGIVLDDIRKKGQEILASNPQLPEKLQGMVHPQDIATLIYTSGTTGQPKGVQLTQENVSYNGMTGFADIHGLQSDEVGMSLLPLAHVFQRTMHYAVLAHGWPIYFTKPTS